MSDWGTETGLISDYAGTVEESYFGTDSRFGNQFFIFWKVKVDNPLDYPQLEDGVIEERYTCGPGWETMDGGETAQFPGTESKKFHASSQYGKVIDKAIGEFGLAELLQSRGSPQEASVWNGLRFHFNNIATPYDFTDEQGIKRVGVSNRNYPDVYLGTADDPIKIQAAGGGVDIDALGLTPELLVGVKAAAKGSSSQGEFVDKVMGLTGAVENDKLVLALANSALYDTLNNEG